MEVIKNKISMDIDLNKYFETENLCFLDIETLGFSREYHNIYLVGLVYYSKEDRSWIIEQIFINSLEKEKDLLLLLKDRMKNFELLITYNGDSFDLPFIEARAQKYGIKNIFYDIASYDIYRVIRKNGKYLELDNLKLKTIEEYLGIYRKDQVTGGQCIDIYLRYLEEKDPKLKDLVLGHNYEDLYYLTDILEILDHIDRKISFQIDGYKFRIKDFKLRKEKISIYLSSNKDLNIAYYANDYSLRRLKKKNYLADIELEKAYIQPGTICHFFDTNLIDSHIPDSTNHLLDKNILIIAIENKEIIENMRRLVRELFKMLI